MNGPGRAAYTERDYTATPTVKTDRLANGRIHSAPIAAYVGTEAEQLINQLGSFAAR
jgi:hypothetical protein